MNDKFENILRTWAEEEIKSAPDEHSQKTSSCLSFVRFDKYFSGTIELSKEEKQHIETCPYCQKVEVMFRRKIEEESEEEFDVQEIINEINSKPDLTILNEDKVCHMASLVLKDLVVDRAPEPEDLILNFRIGLEQNTLFDFDTEEYETVGEGIGGYALEWTTTVVINLVSIFTWISLSKDPEYLSNTETYTRLKEDLLKKSEHAKELVSSAMDKVRDRILSSI